MKIETYGTKWQKEFTAIGRKGQSDGAISVIFCINTLFNRADPQWDGSLFCQGGMSNIIMVYNTENISWQATSVLYWATKEGQILPTPNCCENSSLIMFDPQSSQLKGRGPGGVGVGGDATRSISQRWTGRRGCLCLESTPLYAVQSLRASAAVRERVVAHVLRKWFRRQRGGSQKENKFITLPYLHILLPKDLSMRTVKKWEGLILSSESY